MHMRHHLTRRALIAMAAIGVLCGASATLAGATKLAVGSGRAQALVTPGPPLYRRVGAVGAGGGAVRARAAIQFSCQANSPPTCYGPAQIRAAYGTDQLSADGAGQTIVIVDPFQSPTIKQDLADFDSLFGIPAPPSLQILAPDGLTPFDQGSPDQVSSAGDITLDVEWAHAIAPAANIDLVLAKTNADSDIESALQYAVTNHLGNVISMSFGEAEACLAATTRTSQHAVFQTAANSGMTLLAPSADQGAAMPTCDGSSFMKAVSTPASDPLVTGVGGTLLRADGTTGAYQSESVWNEPGFNAASGGGFSTLYPAPAYQASLGLGSRGVPDVAYNAGFGTGVLIVWSTSGAGPGLVFDFGGTSAGAPQWAGLVAMADELAGHSLGSINPTLYQIASDPSAYSADFHDITMGDNTYDGLITVAGYSAAAGWDPASGLGTPRANALVPRLALGFDPTPPVVSCGGADGHWHADNVSIRCTASDPVSGLADPSQASFSLATDVPAGQSDADAQTNSVKVCDKAGNCTTAGPISGNMIDRQPPAVTLRTPPEGASYSALKLLLSGGSVRASYSCTDAGSGVAACQGNRPNGAKLNISLLSIGRHSFTVTATDEAGNKTSVTHHYTVTL
jgi:hypothetical protein